MKAMAIERYGEARELRLVDRPRPEPAPGEVLVRLAYAGVNFIDVYMRNGTYARSRTYETPLPLTLGMEGAGTVVETGDGVVDFAPGDRVAYCLVRGSYAEFVCVPAWKLVHVPGDLALSSAAALMLQGSTAHYLTHSLYPLRPGDRALVYAAAGGVGQLLVQLAKARGATVIATVGSAEKATIARERGADHVVMYRTCDVAAATRELTGGAGVDVAYDSIGRDTIARSLRSVRRRGTCVLFGAASGSVTAIDPLELAEAGSLFFTRPHLADYLASGAEIAWRAADLFAAAASGALYVHIDRTFALDRAPQAHEHLEAGASRGKVLLALDA
ncbi:MAG: quinone oxidoreductase [Vulcanimicrobiaceae bacterium]